MREERGVVPALVASATAGRETDEARARREVERFTGQAEKARGAHARRLRSLEDVFGPAVRAAAEEHLEQFTESSSEAIYFAGRALEHADADRDALREELVHVRAVLTNTLAELGRALELPEVLVDRAEGYFRHTRRARPTWLREGARALADARVVLRSSEEPF